MCKLCEIIADPRRCIWVFRNSPLCLICVFRPHKILCIYKKHTGQPGGHNINQMVEIMLRLKKEGERLDYYDHNHFHIVINTRR